MQEYPGHLPDQYISEIPEYLHFLEFKSRNEHTDTCFMILSEYSLAKDWLTLEEDLAWQDI